MTPPEGSRSISAAGSMDQIRSEQMFQLVEQFLSLSRKTDSNEAISALRECFDSPLFIFSASRQILESLGLRPSDALLLSQLPDLARCCRMSRFPKQPVLRRAADAARFLCAHSCYLRVERFYALCLDRNGRLMELLCLQEGTEDGALLSMRALMREVIRVQPSAIVLAHNHPGGTLSPSQEDIATTQSVLQALSAIGVPVLDHLILVREEAVSLRANGYIPEIRWLNQSEDCALLRSWMEEMDLSRPVMEASLSAPAKTEADGP